MLCFVTDTCMVKHRHFNHPKDHKHVHFYLYDIVPEELENSMLYINASLKDCKMNYSYVIYIVPEELKFNSYF